MSKKKDKKKKKKQEDNQLRDIPKYKCVTCGKPMFHPNKKCNACKKRIYMKKKANQRGKDKFTYINKIK